MMGGGGGFGGGRGGGPGGAFGGADDADAVFGTGEKSGLVRRFAAFVAPYKTRFLWVIVSVVVATLTAISIPITIRDAVNSAVNAPGSRPLELVLMMFAGIVLANAAGSFLQQSLSARLAQQVIFDLRRAMFAHLQDVSLSFMDKTHVGRVMSRLQGDVNALQEFMENAVQAVGDLILLIGIVVVLIAMNWQLGLLTITVIPLLATVQAIWVRHARVIFLKARDASSATNAALAENINGIRTVQESRREDVNFDHYAARVQHNFDAQVAAVRISQVMIPTVELLTGFAMAIVIVVGGEKVLGRSIDIGVMVAYIFYVQRFFDPIRTLAMQYTMAQRAMTAGARIFEVLDAPVQLKDKPGAIPLGDDVAPSIVFDHVTFGYKEGQPVLKDINIDVKPGQTVALVGPTGSGKTSIASLTKRFYDVWQGSVKIGGRDVRDVTLDSLGKTIAMVLQEPFLFTGTVMENIRYASGASDADVIAAAKAVRAHEFIETLPQGYGTMMGQRGNNLSLGQRQLVSFARALVADPKILILDEATASIDSFTEQDIQRALKVLFRDRTSLVIAHRLATVRDADKIVVLQQGRIIEQGAHDELIALGGLYAHLYTSNYSSFDDVQPQDEAGATPPQFASTQT
ncbi:ABC transporter ATP-binding protein [Sphingobium nicotianae]|uniref:ABC transporter ATP-binding protein/permease n=1 Tax=Sphingobium nicotianae TaxID=2782607 RepID=A0A9X1ISI7_9SPHN|nr:ABC transporter ATP-binding protein [Sphingobium nicotianae]MBT2188235.1 ABC transporter ATP-binding protein/permease [Sphingobium nicotianae]